MALERGASFQSSSCFFSLLVVPEELFLSVVDDDCPFKSAGSSIIVVVVHNARRSFAGVQDCAFILLLHVWYGPAPHQSFSSGVVSSRERVFKL